MVKVYVELVWDIHFPGKLTRGADRGKTGRFVSIQANGTKQHFHTDNKEEKSGP